MTEFEFQSVPSPGTNRTARPHDDCVCGGDRFILVDDTDGRETYARCPTCNPGPVREPVAEKAWWKE